MRKLIVASCLIAGLTCGADVSAKEPMNIETAKQEVINYYDSGQYSKDVSEMVAGAKKYIEKRVAENSKVAQPKKLAVVFDIDDTVLSTYPFNKKANFCSTVPEKIANEKKGDEKAIPEMRSLYKFIQSKNIPIFLITGRHIPEAGVTMKNLQREGFSNWAALYMHPDAKHAKHIADVKTVARKNIVCKGYDIILNVGDQKSDLYGGYADAVIKLPNPYYIVP